MLRQSIIQKMTSPPEVEIEFTEDELKYIASEWLRHHFKVDIADINTRGYMEDIYVKHGLRVTIKK